MRFGHYGNRNLEGCKTLQEWLLKKIDAAELTAREGEDIIFILPLTNTRYTIRWPESLASFKKKVAKCVALQTTATRNAQKRKTNARV